MLPAPHTAANNTTATAGPGLAPAKVPSVQPRILVVDDNVDAAELLADYLALMGYATRIAHDGPSALMLAAEFKPEVALLDIGLPAMDGYELAGLLRGLPDLSRVCLLAVTGYGQETDRRAAEQSGFNAHLVKPVDLERLRSLMQDMTSSAPRSDRAPGRRS